MTRLARASALLVCAACAGSDPVAAGRGSPARLDVGPVDTVILNTVQPARLPVHVLDRAGRVLADSAVRYQSLRTDARMVVDSSAIACVGATDATVRVSLGQLQSDLLVRCRPVEYLLFEGPVQLHLGDSARRLPVRALDAAMRPVQQLQGIAVIGSDGVASLDGLTITPRAEGATVVTVVIGDRKATTGVHVYAPAASLEGLTSGSRLVAVPITLGPGEMRRWSLPPGGWMLTMLPEDDSLGLRLRIEGARCTDGIAFSRRRFICDAARGASVTIYHPRREKRWLSGELLVKAMSTP